MARGKYATVKIPLKLASMLDRMADEMGYQSRADIVDDAIRRFIESQVRFENARYRRGADSEEEMIPLRSGEPSA